MVQEIRQQHNVVTFAEIRIKCAAFDQMVAIADSGYRDDYCAQAAESRALLYAACASLGVQTWPGSANFVLARVGPGVDAIVAALSERGVLVRNRSADPGCEGCIRITAGHTEWVTVQKGREANGNVEIFGDLKPGDQLVATASDELKGGTLVKVD